MMQDGAVDALKRIVLLLMVFVGVAARLMLLAARHRESSTQAKDPR